MKYVVVEGISEEDLLKAGKARTDALEIAEKSGFKPLKVNSVQGVRSKKWQKPVQFYHYKNNARKWDKTFSKLNAGDTVFIQYPLINTSLNFGKLIKKHASRLNFIVLIHDLESLRYNENLRSKAFLKRVRKDDFLVLSSAKKVISHNEKMTKKLIDFGILKKKIVNLEIFDYLGDKNAKTGIKNDVVIAGNLSTDKAGYLKALKNLKTVGFSLYGINFDEKLAAQNISYQGVFPPDKLVENLKGSFGLVWDGDKNCRGFFGEYLKINNPHKLSLYLSGGLPVIVWKESALAEFIEKNQLGLTLESLDKLPNALKKITPKEYQKLQKNALAFSKKLESGYFLKKALES